MLFDYAHILIYAIKCEWIAYTILDINVEMWVVNNFHDRKIIRQ